MKPIRRVLVTNDDGVDAPGLAVAERIAAAVADEVWVVAPIADQSGVGQGISMHHPLRMTHYGERRYAISGTPADCVMAAMAEWLRDTPPDLVLSGVNWGANLADSVMYSGTVGAVLAADHFGLPAIALSQAFHERNAFDFTATEALAVGVIERLWRAHVDAADTLFTRCCWNINFPMIAPESVRGLRFTRQGDGSVRAPQLIAGTDGRGLGYHWLSFERDTRGVTDPHADVVALRDGYLSVMPLRGSRCDEPRFERHVAGGEWRLDNMHHAE